jgi:probable O-glycosylation ligase (exosortase A-associated)
MQTDIQNKSTTLRSRRILSGYQLLVISLVFLSVVLGLALPFLPEIGQFMLVAIVPAAAVFILILRNPYLGVYFFFFYSVLRPYDFLPFLRPLRLTMLIEILTLVSWVVSLIISREKVKWSWMHTMFLLFVAIIGATVVTAWNNYYAYQTTQAMAIYFLMFVITSNVVRSVDRIKQLVWLLLGIHAFFALKGIMTFVTGTHYIATTGQYTSGEVGGGFIGDENDFAMTINMMIPFAFFGFFYLKRKARLISGILLLIFILAVISSFSRGGWVGLAAVLTYGIFNVKKKFGVIGLMLMLGTTAALFAPQQYWEEVSTVADTDESTASARIRFWRAGLGMFLGHPIIGVGAANGGIHMPMYIRGVRDANTQWGRAFHGTWIQVLAELGLLGTFVYLAMIVMIFRWLYRIRRLKVPNDPDNSIGYLATALIGSFIGYFTSATFLSTAYYPQLWTMYMLAIALVFCVDSSLTADKQRAQQISSVGEQAT